MDDETTAHAPDRRGGWSNNLLTTALAWTALALFAGSLFLPIGDAQEWGTVRGWYILYYGLYLAFAAAFSGKIAATFYFSGVLLLYLALPASLQAARKSYVRAAVFAGLALVPPAYLLATKGLYLHPILSNRTVFAIGLVCWFASAVLMTLAWTVAIVRSRTPRGEQSGPGQP
jgi:hypothetical protein